MTGIERLRTLAGAWEEWGLGGELADVADQIDRELREERDRWESDLYEAQVEWNRVTGVCLEMERHCLYNEDTVVRDVARWARELRHAMKSDASDECGAQKPSWHDHADAADVTSGAAKVTRDPSEDVSMSAYDLLPQEDRDAIAWVRDHGGLEKIIQQRRDSIPRAAFERKLGKRLRHIAECEEALRRRNATISALEKAADSLRKQIADMRPRLMPEGCEWPRFEDGARLAFEDELPDFAHTIYKTVKTVKFLADGTAELTNGGGSANVVVIVRPGERVKRPAPKVLDADGVEIREGDTVYEVGENYPPFIVDRLPEPGAYRAVKVTYPSGASTSRDPERLTHTKPEPHDSWQRIEEDKALNPFDYCKKVGHKLWTFDNAEEFKASDLVRRCRALAERERGE